MPQAHLCPVMEAPGQLTGFLWDMEGALYLSLLVSLPFPWVSLDSVTVAVLPCLIPCPSAPVFIVFLFTLSALNSRMLFSNFMAMRRRHTVLSLTGF